MLLLCTAPPLATSAGCWAEMGFPPPVTAGPRLGGRTASGGTTWETCRCATWRREPTGFGTLTLTRDKPAVAVGFSERVRLGHECCAGCSCQVSLRLPGNGCYQSCNARGLAGFYYKKQQRQPCHWGHAGSEQRDSRVPAGLQSFLSLDTVQAKQALCCTRSCSCAKTASASCRIALSRRRRRRAVLGRPAPQAHSPALSLLVVLHTRAEAGR